MKKTIAKVGYAPITTTGETDTYDEVKWFESEKAGGREYTAEPRGEMAEIYADGKTVLSEDENDGYNIKLTLLSLIDDISKDWLGRTADSTGGIAEYANATEFPRFALLLSEKTTDGKGLISTYYNCQMSARPPKSGKTSEGKLEGQYFECEIAARPRVSDSLVCYEMTGTALPTKVPEPGKATAGA